MSIKNLIRPDLLNFNSYSSARDEAKQGKVWLNANESPYNNNLNRYPQKQAAHVIEQLASLYQVKSTQVVLSRGSDEVIDLLIRLFCKAGEDSILICPPTFGMYEICAQLQNARTLQAPLHNETFQLDIELIKKTAVTTTKILFLCSPNNPTGNLLSTNEVTELCEHFAGQAIVVVDEAYIEFADEPSMSCLLNRFENLVILRTLSKAYGLASARCGVLLAQEELVSWILKIMAPYPLPTLVTDVLFQSLQDENLKIVQQQIAVIKDERKKLSAALSEISAVKKVYSCSANFVLIAVNDAKKVMTEFTRQGVIIRDMSSKLNLDNCVRITVGLPEENKKVIKILSNI